MHPLHVVLYIIAALALGSFLNVIIYRLPRGESLISPGSRCPACGKPIRIYDNVPLFSFLALMGKCRYCRTPIPFRYPLVDALTAILLTSLLAVYGPSPHLIAFVVLTLFLIPIAFIDLQTGYILDKLTIPAFILGIPLILGLQIASWKAVLVGAGSGAGTLIFFAILGKFLFRKESMGIGDIKLMGVIGVYLGFPGALIALFLGGLAGFAVVFAGLITKKLRIHDAIPFGPFIAIGTIGYILGGDWLIHWYMGLYQN